MFTLNTTVDDSSPLIRYAPEDAWQAGSVNWDRDVASYWGGGYMHTFHANATATFEFNGTGVSVLGGKRNFRGEFTVDLDGESTNHDAYAAEDEIQTVLFGASGLAQRPHTLTLIVRGQSLDIDAISWWSDVGSGDRVDYKEQVVDDTSSAMTFTPQNAWTTTGDFSAFHGSSGHSSGAARAQMSYSFQGDAISIFGSTGPESGSFTVQLDGSPSSEHSARTESSHTRVLLFQADNLGTGNHTIIVANEEEATLSLDYAVVYVDPSSTTTTTTSGTSSSTSNPAPSSVSNLSQMDKTEETGLIVGLSIAGALCLVLGIALLILWRRQKKLRQRIESRYRPDPAKYPPFTPPSSNFDEVMIIGHQRGGSLTRPLMAKESTIAPTQGSSTLQTRQPPRLSLALDSHTDGTAPSRYVERFTPSGESAMMLENPPASPRTEESSSSASLISRFSEWSRKHRNMPPPPTRRPSGPRPQSHISQRRSTIYNTIAEHPQDTPSVSTWRAGPDPAFNDSPPNSIFNTADETRRSVPPAYWQSQQSPLVEDPELHRLEIATQSDFYCNFSSNSHGEQSPSYTRQPAPFRLSPESMMPDSPASVEPFDMTVGTSTTEHPIVMGPVRLSAVGGHVDGSGSPIHQISSAFDTPAQRLSMHAATVETQSDGAHSNYYYDGRPSTVSHSHSQEHFRRT